MKIAVGMIVFNSDFVLKQALQAIYPHVNQILVSEGCVKYWSDKGITTSTDQTNEILKGFPDPDHKIHVVHGTYTEKDDQANAYMKYVEPDTDYVWNLDADEVFKEEDIVKLKAILAAERPTSVGFKSITFYGGFNHYLTGFEQEHEFIRIQKYSRGAVWKTHRPPTIELPAGTPRNHLSFERLAQMGIYMYHYSYVFPRQVKEKISYYEAAVIKKDGCIPNYFETVYRDWVMGDDATKQAIEKRYKGVHEFVPESRGECYTAKFTGLHPHVIIQDWNEIQHKYNSQIKRYLTNIE